MPTQKAHFVLQYYPRRSVIGILFTRREYYKMLGLLTFLLLYSVITLLKTLSRSITSSFSLSFQICDDTSSTRLYHQLLLPTSAAQSSARLNFTAAPHPLPTIPAMYQNQAELLLTFFAVYFDILTKDTFASYAEEVIAALRDLFVDIKLCKATVKKPGSCRCIVWKLIKRYQNKRYPRPPSTPPLFVPDFILFVVHHHALRTFFGFRVFGGER